MAQTYNLDELARKQRINEMKSRLLGIQRKQSINMQWGEHESDNDETKSNSEVVHENDTNEKKDNMIMLDKNSTFDSFY